MESDLPEEVNLEVDVEVLLKLVDVVVEEIEVVVAVAMTVVGAAGVRVAAAKPARPNRDRQRISRNRA